MSGAGGINGAIQRASVQQQAAQSASLASAPGQQTAVQQALVGLPGLARVPEIWRGAPSLAAFDALLEKPSHEAKANGVVSDDVAEGVVIRSNPLLRDVFGQWLIIKHKSEKFSEVAKRDPNRTRADLSAATAYALTFVTPGRLVNALGRLRDAGKPVRDGMEDMSLLVPAVLADLQKEAMPEWNEVLGRGVNEKQLRSEVTKTVGIVYRRMLLEAVAGT